MTRNCGEIPSVSTHVDQQHSSQKKVEERFKMSVVVSHHEPSYTASRVFNVSLATEGRLVQAREATA